MKMFNQAASPGYETIAAVSRLSLAFLDGRGSRTTARASASAGWSISLPRPECFAQGGL